MSENAVEETTAPEADQEFATFTEGEREIAYRSEGQGAPGESGAAGEPQAIIAPGMATGRRKRAIARVRIVPGSGQ